MRPDVFKLGNGKCFAVYGDYLIADLPENRLNECLDALDGRRRYEDTLLARDVGAIRTFKLTPAFTMQCRTGPKTFTLKETADGHHPYNGGGAELLAWLQTRLERLGYAPETDNRAKNAVLAGHIVSEILCVAVIGWVFYIIYLRDVLAAGVPPGRAMHYIDPAGLALLGAIVIVLLCGNGMMLWLIRSDRLKIVTYRKQGYALY